MPADQLGLKRGYPLFQEHTWFDGIQMVGGIRRWNAIESDVRCIRQPLALTLPCWIERDTG